MDIFELINSKWVINNQYNFLPDIDDAKDNIKIIIKNISKIFLTTDLEQSFTVPTKKTIQRLLIIII